jgi:hypothetical protein
MKDFRKHSTPLMQLQSSKVQTKVTIRLDNDVCVFFALCSKRLLTKIYRFINIKIFKYLSIGSEKMKTSVDIPDDIWKAAKILAVEESKDLRDVIIEALQEHLGKKAKAKK